ncbi:MAG TPA: universal stress protein [Candidatus Angelobacter sp.]
MQNALSTTGASFKNILFLTDFSPASTPALAYSLALAQHFQARLFPARVMEDAFTSSPVGGDARAIGVLEEKKKHEFVSLESFNGIEFNPLISHS